ncbi:hypothetical protein K438DRAFT_1994992 [Mycena galopus ATCC 62051]|nr:hypothetical protein K438DRAFT_1994992 [Mycena galopus ATCC 62051]
MLQFVEVQGTGVHIVMSAKTALDLGCPIHGILAFTSTLIDKAGHSKLVALSLPLVLVPSPLPDKYHRRTRFLSLTWLTDSVARKSRHGDAKAAAEGKGVTTVLLSLSHSESWLFLIFQNYWITQSPFSPNADPNAE